MEVPNTVSALRLRDGLEQCRKLFERELYGVTDVIHVDAGAASARQQRQEDDGAHERRAEQLRAV